VSTSGGKPERQGCKREMVRAKAVRDSRKRRHARVRKSVRGSPERPRLTVYRSLKNIYAQIIDDTTGITVCSASSVSKEIAGEGVKGPKIEVSKAVGRLVAKKASMKGVKKVVFDKGGYKYHGRIKALADAARESGLEF
jgi:large subunit ribosomal protein L18